MRTGTVPIAKFPAFVASLCMAVVCMAAPALCAVNRWSTTGPYGGMVNAVAVSPNYTSDNTAFAAVGNCGIYRTDDCGLNWTAACSGLRVDASGDYLNVSCFAVSPGYVTDHTVYAGTTGGVCKSVDGGGHWTPVLTGVSVNCLAISPGYVSDGTLFAGTGLGVFMTSDSGASWRTADTGLPGLAVYSLAVSPDYASGHQIVFAGTHFGGLYKTEDGGFNWSPSCTGVPTPYIMCLAISPGYAADGTVFAGTSGSGVYKSSDGGNNWYAVNTDLPSSTVHSLAISPGYVSDRTLFAGTGSGVSMTSDSGNNWSAINTGLDNSDIYAVAISPAYTAGGTVFAGTRYGGVYRAAGPDFQWSKSSAGLVGLGFNAVALSPDYAHDHTVFAGSSGGGVYKSADGGAGWTQACAGLPQDAYGYYPSVNSLAVSPGFATSDNIVFAGTDAGLFKSTDGGTSWAWSDEGVTDLDIHSVAVSPDYILDGTVYAGSNGGVFVSRNGGALWEELNSGLYDYNIRSLAVLPVSSGGYKAFAGTDSGVFVTTDAGGAWTEANTGLLCIGVRSLAVSPYNDTVFTGTMLGMFKSTDGGGNWQSTSDSVPGPLYFSALGVSPQFAQDRAVFFGRASNNLFKSEDGGETWAGMDTGLTVEGRGSSHYITSIAVSPDYAVDGTVYACSSGGGVYVYTKSNATPPASAITSLRCGQILSSAYCVVRGTAVSPSGAVVQTVHVSTDGGASWHAASGTADWSYVWRPQSDGNYTIVSRAADTAGLTESPGAGVAVVVDRTRPVSAVTAPVNCAVQIGSGLVIRGTATDAGGTGVSRVELTADGGRSWRTVRDTSGDGSWSSWSYAFTVRGDCAVMSRATDRAGNMERPTRVTTVRLQPAWRRWGFIYDVRWR